MRPLFEWDNGNLSKLEKVRVSGRHFTIDEIESVFDDPEGMVDDGHSDPKTREARYKLTGLSNQNRVLSVIFVFREDKIRIFNVWRAKQTTLKQYYAQKADPGTEETVRAEADADGSGD